MLQDGNVKKWWWRCRTPRVRLMEKDLIGPVNLGGAGILPERRMCAAPFDPGTNPKPGRMVFVL